MKRVVLFCLLIGMGFGARSQNAMVQLQFEDAEKAFNTGDYEAVLHHLDEVEKQVGVTSKTLYLRVVAENQLFAQGGNLYEDEAQFTRLQQLRTHAGQYLKAMSAQGLDDKFREVYRINEQLDQYPATQSAWLEQRKVYLNKLEEQRQQQLADEKRAAQQRKDTEFRQLYAGTLSLHQARYHRVAKITKVPADSTATVFLIRPEEDTENAMQSVIVNGDLVVDKMKTGTYAIYHFTPGLIKLGNVLAENRKKVKAGKALLMGGVIGLAATSGKIIAKSKEPFLLDLKAGKTYFITSIVTKDKTIQYALATEETGKAYVSTYKQVN